MEFEGASLAKAQVWEKPGTLLSALPVEICKSVQPFQYKVLWFAKIKSQEHPSEWLGISWQRQIAAQAATAPHWSILFAMPERTRWVISLHPEFLMNSN